MMEKKRKEEEEGRKSRMCVFLYICPRDPSLIDKQAGLGTSYSSVSILLHVYILFNSTHYSIERRTLNQYFFPSSIYPHLACLVLNHDTLARASTTPHVEVVGH